MQSFTIQRFVRAAMAVSVFAILGACAGSNSMPENAVACEEPRMPMCTREYRPVCGMGESGTKTYSNGCEACANADVKYHTPGACESDADPAHTNRPGRPIDGE